jgi:DNA-directed RNA polymerase subunit RPC12/RpoP
MEQRTYRGNVQPEGLADYLVATFNQGYHTVAQRAGQGDQILVQIGQARHSGWRGIRNAMGVSLVRTPNGLTVSIGQSNWLNLVDAELGGMLIGAIFFPPLLIFPLLRGARTYALYQDIWTAIDGYCARMGATPTDTMSAPGVYCPRCGVLNHEDARFCSTCGAELQTAPPPPTAVSEQVVCAECHQTVPAGRYCNNCGASLQPTM